MEKNPEFQKQNQELADEFAKRGTLQCLLLQLGFMPYDEDCAKLLAKSILEDNECGLSTDEIFEIERLLNG